MTDGAQDDKLLAAVTGDAAYIVVRGRATFKISPAFKRLCTGLMEGPVRQIILDMSGCPGMDSTFMGVIAGLSLKLEALSGKVMMINLSAYLRGLISTLGLDTLVEVHGAGLSQIDMKEIVAQCKPVSTETPSSSGKDLSARTMLDAHETLARLLPENEEKFKDVLKYLRAELSTPDQSAPSDAGDSTVKQ